jgi:hypothetical protein
VSGWGRAGRPSPRIPRWAYLAVIALLAIGVAVGLVHTPSRSERAADLTGVLQTMNADIESCAGGVSESLTALREISAGASRDVTDAVTVAETGASNCSPANNELIDDLEAYEVPESLARFHLQGAVTGLIGWAAPDAEQVQSDVAAVLSARSPQDRAAARQVLARGLRRLDAQRAVAEKPIRTAISALAVQAAPPRLPG